MVLLRTALHNLKKNVMMNIFVILEMTATIIIVMVMISSVLLRYRYYAPFKDMFNSKGIYVEFTSVAAVDPYSTETLDLLRDTEILEYLNNPTGIAACNIAQVSIDGKGFDSLRDSCNNYCYNDTVIESFTPELAEGEWLKTSDEADKIELVVSENEYGWEVGDTVTLEFGFYDEDKGSDTYEEYEGEIVGKLADSTKIYGGYQEHSSSDDFNILYTTYDYEIEQAPIVLMSSEYVAEQIDDDNNPNIYLNCSQLITYPDSVTEDEINEDIETLAGFGAGLTNSLDEMNENSKAYLYEQVYNLMPVIVVILILTLVSDISSTALSTRRRLHDYAIYYLVGLRWRQCVVINVIQSFVMSIAAAILSLAAIGIISFTPYASKVKIIRSGWTFLGVLILVAVYLIMSTLMPILIIGKSTPKEILTK